MRRTAKNHRNWIKGKKKSEKEKSKKGHEKPALAGYGAKKKSN